MTRKVDGYFTKEALKKSFAPSNESLIVKLFTGIVVTFALSIFTVIMFTLYLAPIIGAVLCICKAAGTLESMTWVQACSPFMAYTIASISTLGIFRLGNTMLDFDDDEEEEVEETEEIEIEELVE